ncbi:RHS repeat-associated core domain-containing protein [Pseudomonas fluorescens]|nr:RHS repeat-associated core domain-containing protein [Pseudomonas fluorescens]
MRVSQTVHLPESRAHHTRDPRLFASFQEDITTPANQTTITSLSGALLLSVNVDAGWRLSLSGASGQPLESWDQKLNHHRIEYDAWLRPAFVFDRETGEPQRRRECMSYADASAESSRHNRCGQLIRHDDTAGAQSFSEFSLFGAPVEQARRFLKALVQPDWPADQSERDTLLEDQSAITRMGYNAAGELIFQIDALGNEQLLRQTHAGELSETRLKLAGADGYTTLVADIRYNALGQMEQQIAGNGVVTRSFFDPQSGQLETLLAQVANEPPLQHLAYKYDAAGNVLSITDSAQPIRYFRNQRIAPTNSYRYDTLYQLIEAQGRQWTSAAGGPQLPEFVSPPDAGQLENYRQTFDYDSGGNLLALQHSADSGQRSERTAVSATSNRSLPYTVAGQPPQEGEIANRYDATGNLSMLQAGQNLLWDGRNQLRQVDQVVREDGPNDTECYVYDGAGQRLRKVRTVRGARLNRTHETRYLPGVEIRTSPEEILHVISVQAGRCTVQIVHWEKGRPTRIADDQHRYILTDHLGSSSLELDADARLISQESYYAYGGTAWWAGRDKVEASYRTLRYSGQERDATGFYYYGLRYYMPWRQRWLSADPGGAHDGLNLYRMVGGNPIGFVDLQGLVKTRVSRMERAKVSLAGVIRGGVTGVVGNRSKYYAQMGLKAALGESARYPLALMTAVATAYASAAATAHIENERGVSGFSKQWKVTTMGTFGFAVGFAGGYSSSDPIDVLSDVAKDLAGVTTGRAISLFGPSITYDANATLGSQAVNIFANLIVNFAEGVWLGPFSKSVNPMLRAAVNGAIKSIVGANIRASEFVPASYNASKHSSAWGLPTLSDVKAFVKKFTHDTAMSSVYGLVNTDINSGLTLAFGANTGESSLRAGVENLQIANQMDAIVGEMVLSGANFDDVNAIPNETTPKADTSANLQAAEQRRETRSQRKNGGRIPLMNAA